MGLRPQSCSSSGMGRVRKSPEKVLAVVKGDDAMAPRGSATVRPAGSGGFTLPVDMAEDFFLELQAHSPDSNESNRGGSTARAHVAGRWKLEAAAERQMELDAFHEELLWTPR